MVTACALLRHKKISESILRLLLSCVSSTNPSLPVFLTALPATNCNGFLRWSFLLLESRHLLVPSRIQQPSVHEPCETVTWKSRYTGFVLVLCPLQRQFCPSLQQDSQFGTGLEVCTHWARQGLWVEIARNMRARAHFHLYFHSAVKALSWNTCLGLCCLPQRSRG